MPSEAQTNLGATNNCALASLILSICFVFLGPLGSIPGIICGRIALREYKAARITEGQGMAKAGIVIGWIGLALFVISLAIGIFIMIQTNRTFDALNNLF